MTSISIGTYGAFVDPQLQAYSVPLAAMTCSTEAYMRRVYGLSGNSGIVATSASFPTPLVVRPPAGSKVCLYASNYANTILGVRPRRPAGPRQ